MCRSEVRVERNATRNDEMFLACVVPKPITPEGALQHSWKPASLRPALLPPELEPRSLLP